MTILSYTSYVHHSTDDVRGRLRDAHVSDADLEITPFVDRTRIVLRYPWDETDESTRRASTLAATRLAMRITELAAA